MAIIIYRSGWSRLGTSILPGCKWIEITLLATILVCHIEEETLVVETYTGCNPVRSLPVGIIRRCGIDGSLRSDGLVAVGSFS